MLPLLLAAPLFAAETPTVEWGPDGNARVAQEGVPRPGSADRARLVGDQLFIGPPGSTPTPIAVPGLVHDPLFRLIAWVDSGRLYLHASRDPAAEPAHDLQPKSEGCAILTVATGAWSEPKACVDGDFYRMYDVRFQDGVAFVGSAGEGHPGLLVYRWTPEGGRGELMTPPLDLYHSGPAEGWLRNGRVEIATPCKLGEERPCAGDDVGDAPWRLYAVVDGRFVLLRDGLPAGFVPHPTEDRWAWGEPGQICEASPKSAKRCRPVPPTPAP